MRGSIVKRGKTYSIVYYCVNPKTGEKEQKWEGGYITKPIAQKALTKKVNDINNGNYIALDKITLEEYLKDWMEVFVTPRLKQTTVDGYQRNITKHVIPYIGKIPLQKLKAMNIERLYNTLRQSGRVDGNGGLSAKSIVYVHRVLRKALSQAYKNELISKNPADLVTPPSAPKYRAKVFDAESIVKLLNGIKGSKYELTIALAALSGLRRGEALGLRWSDVNLRDGTITVNQQLVPTSKGLQFDLPKTDSSNRTILVSPYITELLSRQRKLQSDQQKLLGDAYQKYNLVCCHEDGSPINPSHFSKIFANILEANKLEHIRFHDLRHSNATAMLRANIPHKVASKMLGHSSIGITMDLYSHVLPQMQQEAVNAIDAQIFGSTNGTKESNKA
jgi:integrase